MMMEKLATVIISLFVVITAFQIVTHGTTLGRKIGYLYEDLTWSPKRVIRYQLRDIQDSEAADSIRGLLYAINRVSWWSANIQGRDDWTRSENPNIGEELRAGWYVADSTDANGRSIIRAGVDQEGDYKWGDFSRVYGDTQVIATIVDGLERFYHLDNPSSASKDQLLKDIAFDMVECFMQMKSSEETQRCYQADFRDIPEGVEIKADDIKRGFDVLKEDEELCNEDCRSYLGHFDTWYVSEIWGQESFDFDIPDGKITNQHAGYEDNVLICAKPGNLLEVDGVTLTTDREKCESEGRDLFFTMVVKDFNLPQVGQNMEGVGRLFLPHGDPNYILYYEQFPEGEDEAWTYSAFTELQRFFAAEVILYGIRVIPIVGPILGNLMSKVPGLRIAIGAIGTRLITVLEQGDIGGLISTAGDLIRIIMDPLGSLLTGVYQATSYEEKTTDDLAMNFLVTKYAGINFFDSQFGGLAHDFINTENRDELNSRESAQYSKLLGIKTVCKQRFKDALGENPSIVWNDHSLAGSVRSQLDSDIQNILSQLDESSKEREKLSDQQKTEFKALLLEELEKNIDYLWIDYLWYYMAANEANYKLIELWDMYHLEFDGLTNDDKQQLGGNGETYARREINSIADQVDEIYRKMPSKKDYDKQRGIALQMMVDEQEINYEFLTRMGVDSSSGDRDVINQRLDFIAASMLNGVDLPEGLLGRADLPADFRLNSRSQLSNLILMREMREMSIADKFKVQGTNVIGLKTPYKQTIRFTDEGKMEDKTFPADKGAYDEFFDHFGGEWTQYEGDTPGAEPPDDFDIDHQTQDYMKLLPEVNKFYLSLIRDKAKYWFDQPNIRFHLVSPCKADLMIRETYCECYGKPTETINADEEGLPEMEFYLNPSAEIVDSAFNAIEDQFDSKALYETKGVKGGGDDIVENGVNSFDGEYSMLYSRQENGVIVKECLPKDIFRGELPWHSASYTPRCIEIDPVIDTSVYPNYCYRGMKPIELGVLDVVLNWGLPIGCGVIGMAGSPIASAIAGSICGVIGRVVYAPIEHACYSYPMHGGVSVFSGGGCLHGMQDYFYVAGAASGVAPLHALITS